MAFAVDWVLNTNYLSVDSNNLRRCACKPRQGELVLQRGEKTGFKMLLEAQRKLRDELHTARTLGPREFFVVGPTHRQCVVLIPATGGLRPRLSLSLTLFDLNCFSSCFVSFFLFVGAPHSISPMNVGDHPPVMI